MSKNQTYIKAALWFILSIFISACNDLLTKLLDQDLPSSEVVFFRFLFSIVTLLPFVVMQGKEAFRTSYIYLHIVRGTILCGAITLWVLSLYYVPIVVATIMSFTIPLFLVIQARVFLKEKIGLQRSLITIVGFVGVIVILAPSELHFGPEALLLAVAAMLFAALDIINKKYIAKESMLNMLFYSSVVTASLALIPTIIFWKQPSMSDLGLCLLLGCGANILLFAILKAFAMADASALAPFRYMELIFSSIFGVIFFSEIPSFYQIMGAAIIIPATLALVYHESRKKPAELKAA